MTLLGSSKPSGKSNKVAKPERSAKDDLDFSLKLKTASAFAASGYSCRLNVALSAVGDSGLADVTDVDVLAIGRDLTFTPRVICVSCKAGTNLVVAKELFYLRGVLDYMRGDEGILLLSNRELSPHLRELAATLSLLVLATSDVDEWHAALTNGLQLPGYFQPDRFQEYENAIRAIPNSHGLATFLKADYWFYRDFRNVQNLIGHFRRYARGLDGTSRFHSIQFLDIAWHFSQTVLDLCLHVQRGGISRIEESVTSYLFGGRTSYKARKDLLTAVTQLLTKTGVANETSIPPLDPAYAKALAELVLRFLERPHAAIRVPLVLQDVLWRNLGAPGINESTGKNNLAAFKLASDLVEFLKLTADAPWAPAIN